MLQCSLRYTACMNTLLSVPCATADDVMALSVHREGLTSSLCLWSPVNLITGCRHCLTSDEVATSFHPCEMRRTIDIRQCLRVRCQREPAEAQTSDAQHQLPRKYCEHAFVEPSALWTPSLRVLLAACDVYKSPQDTTLAPWWPLHQADHTGMGHQPHKANNRQPGTQSWLHFCLVAHTIPPGASCGAQEAGIKITMLQSTPLTVRIRHLNHRGTLMILQCLLHDVRRCKQLFCGPGCCVAGTWIRHSSTCGRACCIMPSVMICAP